MDDASSQELLLLPLGFGWTGETESVFKSGPLFISSKGIGWKSWKKRWFILTRTSLIFFKNDPNSLPQRGGEVNVTLGGIDLNNSGSVILTVFPVHSVVVREDKKLLTVLFPDGRDGRAFTLKAETSEDLLEWKTALEEALAQAPNAALVIGHNGIFRREKRPTKSLVVGRPILLALEDIDGSPSFLEKALCFLEKHGIKVEGILRQAADVEEVDRRMNEYEQGRTEFAPDEDAHVVGDCVKHVLRELPSSPVPASCCTALLEAFRLESKESRINSMRAAMSETFPEPNRRLLQRILRMMHTVASHTTENRMTPSAVAACMAPLLLRPLLAGECEMEDDIDMSDDNSAQLIAAANAANNAQCIVTTLLEEYESIFDDEHPRCSLSPDSRIQDSGSESTDDETVDAKDNGFHDAENDVDQELDERILSGNLSESSACTGADLYDYQVDPGDSDAERFVTDKALEAKSDLKDAPHSHLNQNGTINVQRLPNGNDPTNLVSSHESPLSMGEILSSLDAGVPLPGPGAEHSADRQSKSNETQLHVKRSNIWGRSNSWFWNKYTTLVTLEEASVVVYCSFCFDLVDLNMWFTQARKSQQSEFVDSSGEEELAIQRLEIAKNDLQIRIAKEVSRLQEQLQAERDLRAALEVGLSMSSGQFSGSRAMDSKTKAELEEIALAEADVARLKQKVAELHVQLSQQRQHQYDSLVDENDRYQHRSSHLPQSFVQPGFDTKLAFCNQEKKQRNEESLSGASHWRSIKQHVLTQASSKPFSRKHSLDASSSDSRETSSSMPAESGAMSANNPRAGEAVEYGRQPPVPSSTLVELTTRLDFFKERRSQLMEQLHSLDLGHGSAPHGFQYKSSSPWNSPR
ncbi:unnamed protein product [Triticum turgidum subsp. durum]|uniref:Rho GTPase-activating protein 7 n=2 Tax=Triticinae TaxID=1648030 RepID=A0A9R1R3N5_TRITD|nr:unnamed protein product [Triticum turgidum subsp. durum]